MVRKDEIVLGWFPYGTEMRNRLGIFPYGTEMRKSFGEISVWYGNVKLLRGVFRILRKGEIVLGWFPYGTERRNRLGEVSVWYGNVKVV